MGQVLKVRRKTKFIAVQINTQDDLNNLIVENFDDNFEVRIYNGRVRLTNPDFVETFKLGDWCILDESLRMNFVDTEFLNKYYEVCND